MNLKKSLLIYTLLGIAMVCLVGLLWFITRPAYSNMESVIPDLELTSKEFLSELRTPKSDQPDRMVDMTIQIKGVIDKVSFKNNTHTFILVGDGASEQILCELQKGQENLINKYQTNDTVVIKGVYKGSLLDAIFLHCVIIETPFDE